MPYFDISPLEVTLTVSKYAGKFYLPLLNTTCRNSKLIPKIENDIFYMSAVELSEKIRIQEITSVHVVQLFIDRIKQVNPILNAVLDERFSNALTDAAKADCLCKKSDKIYLKEKYPLLGVPFTVKEAISVKYLSQSCGVKYKRKNVSAENAVVINYLQQAGAIPLCVTNVPEFLLSWESQNLIIGRTLNPYNTLYSPGGSSGGEAALIGSGASVFGIGTDLIGSCRLPAMFCGIYGHRPTRTCVSIEGINLLFTEEMALNMITIGPMTRYATDLPLIMEIMCGPENAKLLNLYKEINIRTLTLNVCRKYDTLKKYDLKISKEILHCLKNVESAFDKEGTYIKCVNIEINELFLNLFYRIMSFDKKLMIEKTKIPNTKWSIFNEYLRLFIGISNHTFFTINSQVILRNKSFYPEYTRENVERKIKSLEIYLNNILEGEAVLILPTFPTCAFRHYSSLTCTSATQYLLLPSVFNLPSTTIPLGLNDKGLPLGIQVIAGKFKDHLCFNVAKFLEQKFGGWVAPK